MIQKNNKILFGIFHFIQCFIQDKKPMIAWPLWWYLPFPWRIPILSICFLYNKRWSAEHTLFKIWWKLGRIDFHRHHFSFQICINIYTYIKFSMEDMIIHSGHCNKWSNYISLITAHPWYAIYNECICCVAIYDIMRPCFTVCMAENCQKCSSKPNKCDKCKAGYKKNKKGKCGMFECNM